MATWLRGVSGMGAADGSFAAWVGNGFTVDVGGTWNDSQSAQPEQWSIQPGLEWGSWTGPLVVAVGAIYKSAGESWAAAATGAYDARWTTMLNKFVTYRTGEPTWIRFAHEFNLNGMPWSVTAAEATNFKAAWVRFRSLQQAIYPSGNLVWNPNAGSNTGIDVLNAYPGASAFDTVGIDFYNGYPAVNTVTEAQTQFNATQGTSPQGLERWRQQALSWGKPLALCEWATNGDPNDAGQGKDAPVWIQYLFDWLTTHGGTGPGKVSLEILFNLPAWGTGQFGFYPTTKSPQAAAKYKQLWPRTGTAAPEWDDNAAWNDNEAWPGTQNGRPAAPAPGWYEYQKATNKLIPLTLVGEVVNGVTTPLTTVGVAVSPVAPTAPTGLQAGAVTSSSLSFTWTETPDASVSGHRIYLNDVRVLTVGAEDRSATVTGLPASTTYTVKVTRFNTAGNSAFSTGITMATSAALVGRPTAPATFTRTGLTQTTATFAWTESADSSVTGHRFYLDGTLRAPLGAGTLSYAVTGLAAGTSHTAYATRFNATGESPPSPVATFTTLAPATTTVLYGACPHNNASPADVVTKYPGRPSIRAFNPNTIGTSAVSRPTAASIVHWSWKQTLGSTPTRAQLVATFANLRSGDIVEVQHELDAKVRTGGDLTSYMATKANFHAAVVAARIAGDIPDVRTCNTLTGWAVSDGNAENPDRYAAEADLVGFDWDGIDPPQSSSGAIGGLYYNFFTHEYAEGISYTTRHGYDGWCIPELSTYRSTASDASGTIRVQWINDQITRINAAANRPIYVAFFDFSNRPSVAAHLECLELTNEINAWKAAVASNQ